VGPSRVSRFGFVNAYLAHGKVVEAPGTAMAAAIAQAS
jgi:hypothetical protein